MDFMALTKDNFKLQKIYRVPLLYKKINPSTRGCCRSHANGDFRQPHVQ